MMAPRPMCPLLSSTLRADPLNDLRCAGFQVFIRVKRCSTRARTGPADYGVDQPGGSSHTHYGMLTDQLRGRPRQTNHVEQVDCRAGGPRAHRPTPP
jgi:hypothetical protein